MHSETLITNSISTTNNDHDYDPSSNGSSSNSNSPTENTHDHDHDENVHMHDGEIVLDDEPVAGVGTSDNNPPDSFWISHKNVTDWLNHHTFIERKTSVKMVASSRKFDSGQTRSSQRSVSFNNKPKATIIGFRQKPPVHSFDGKSKQNDRQDHLRLFKNRSVPGKTSGVQTTEPRSPRVSCMGRVGSMRGQARRTGFWKKVKVAIMNRVRTNKVAKNGC